MLKNCGICDWTYSPSAHYGHCPMCAASSIKIGENNGKGNKVHINTVTGMIMGRGLPVISLGNALRASTVTK